MANEQQNQDKSKNNQPDSAAIEASTQNILGIFNQIVTALPVPAIPLIGGSLVGALTYWRQQDIVMSVVVGGIGYGVTWFATYVTSFSTGVNEVLKAKGKAHGKESALRFFNHLEEKREKDRWKRADPNGKW